MKSKPRSLIIPPKINKDSTQKSQYQMFIDFITENKLIKYNGEQLVYIYKFFKNLEQGNKVQFNVGRRQLGITTFYALLLIYSHVMKQFINAPGIMIYYSNSGERHSYKQIIEQFLQDSALSGFINLRDFEFTIRCCYIKAKTPITHLIVDYTNTPPITIENLMMVDPTFRPLVAGIDLKNATIINTMVYEYS